ncbi:hypothetical protein HanRHA438_Chr06g0269901 [Helianthus annuus]|nr:hypothetical protein HanRHA438_Chr06g0269901 [Helianthus annuus]
MDGCGWWWPVERVLRGGEQNDDKLEKSGRKIAIFKLLGQNH